MYWRKIKSFFARRSAREKNGPKADALADPVGGSFRDPSGFLFARDGVLYRQVNHVYREHYDRLMTAGSTPS